MPNFLEQLRLRNIFGQPEMMGNDLPSQGGITGNMPIGGNVDFGVFDTPDVTQPLPTPQMTAIGGGNDFDVMQRMREIYSPETAASDRFNQLLGEQPTVEQFRPSLLRRIGSALTAFGPGGQEAGMEFMNRPFTEQMADWKAGIVPAQRAAELERQQNVNERQLAYQTVSQERMRHADVARAKNQEEANKIRQQRADVYEFKSKNPNVKFDFSGPTVLVADPATGKVTNTGVPTGSMSDMDKINLQQEGRLEAIGATGKEARETEGVRQTGRETLAETRGWTSANIPDPDNPGQMKAILYNQITGETKEIKGVKGPLAKPSGAGGGKGELPTQTKVRQFNAARQLAATRPDLAKFIKFGTSNNFTISTGGFRGASLQQLQEINDAIYGGGQPGRTGSPNVAKQPPKAPKGWKYVPKQGGGWTAVPG